MIYLFIFSLFLTFFVVRIWAHSAHDMKNYGTKKEKSKTVTGWLRIKTGFDWHHFHFGIIISILILFWVLFFGFSKLNVILMAIGLSMISDQIVPIVDRKRNYFHIKNLLTSFLFHVLISIIAIAVYISK